MQETLTSMRKRCCSSFCIVIRKMVCESIDGDLSSCCPGVEDCNVYDSHACNPMSISLRSKVCICSPNSGAEGGIN